MVIDGCVWEWFSSTFENIWEHQTGVLLFFFLRKETVTGCDVIAAFTQLGGGKKAAQTQCFFNKICSDLTRWLDLTSNGLIG